MPRKVVRLGAAHDLALALTRQLNGYYRAQVPAPALDRHERVFMLTSIEPGRVWLAETDGEVSPEIGPIEVPESITAQLEPGRLACSGGSGASARRMAHTERGQHVLSAARFSIGT